MAAGIIVVAASLLLHMNISTGTLNGLILYANLVNISKYQFFASTESEIKVFDCIYIMDELGFWNSSMFLQWTRCIFLCMASIYFPIVPLDIDHTDNKL